jgi:hypothetical protein
MNSIENQHIRFWLEDGILFSEYKHPFDMTLENSKEIYELRAKISNGVSQYFCYDISKLKSMTSEARKYGESEGQNNLIASAIIVNSIFSKFIYSIFLQLYTVKIPTKAFKTKEEAVIWLKGLKNKS